MKEETIRRLKEKNELSKEACRQAMDFAAGQVKENLKEFTHSFKKAYSEEMCIRDRSCPPREARPRWFLRSYRLRCQSR